MRPSGSSVPDGTKFTFVYATSFTVFVYRNSAVPTRPRTLRSRSYPRFPLTTSGYLKLGSIMFTDGVPGVPPVTACGWAFGSATKAIRFAELLVVDRLVRSTPVLPYWFDSQTYGVRPVKNPMPPRSCERCAPPLLTSQWKPIRGDHIFGAGTTLVA